jgi:pimeloyl-ACP methyl ester carboxylesterase
MKLARDVTSLKAVRTIALPPAASRRAIESATKHTSRARYASAVQPPEIRYVKCGGRDLAYEVVGSGTAGFVVFLDIGAHLDLMWTDPAWGQQVDRFGAQWRAPLLQMRGIGQSEPVERLPTLEEQAGDIATVMDAVGLPRAQIMGSGATAPGAVVFAAAHPDRVDGLVLLCPFLSGPLADDPDLTGWEPGTARRWGRGVA